MPVNVIIDAFNFAKVITNVVMQHFSLFDSIVSDQDFVFIGKFLLFFCYFLKIKR